MAKERILYVEDQPDISSLMKIYFTSQGYEMLTAMRGAVALEICSKTPLDLVLLDVNLPDMEGYDIGKALRASPRTRHIPIIFLTARGERADRLKGLGEVLAQYYIVKPFDIEEVHTIIKSQLDEARRKNHTHPVTKLPTAELLNDHMRFLLTSRGWGIALAHINGYETFVQSYGGIVGEDVQQFTALLINEAVNELGTVEDFVGQMVVGPDFVFTSTPERTQAIADLLVARFDAEIGLHYNYKHRKQGFIEVADESGTARREPLMSLSLGVLDSQDGPFYDIRELSETAEEARQHGLQQAREQGKKSWAGFGRASDLGAQQRPRRYFTDGDYAELAADPERALCAAFVVGASYGEPLLDACAAALPATARAFPLERQGRLFVLPGDELSDHVDAMAATFNSHPLVLGNAAARLVYSTAQGGPRGLQGQPSASPGSALRTLLARRLRDRRLDEGITDELERAVLSNEPLRPLLERRYDAAHTEVKLYKEVLDTRADQIARGADPELMAAVSHLTARADHDLGGGMQALRDILPTFGTQISGQESAALYSKLRLCGAWKRTVVELGRGGVVDRRSDPRFGEELVAALERWNTHFGAGIHLKQELHAPISGTLRGDILDVVALHTVLSAQVAGARSLAVRSQMTSDGLTSITILDDGAEAGRLAALRGEASPEGPLYHRLDLLPRILVLHKISVTAEQTPQGFACTWALPRPSIEKPRPILPIPELETEVRRLEALAKKLGEERQAMLAADARISVEALERARRELLPCIVELHRQFTELRTEVERVCVAAQMADDVRKRADHLVLYCLLIVRNLLLAVQQLPPPAPTPVDLREQLDLVIGLLATRKLADITYVIEQKVERALVLMTEVELQQILMNLIKNAVEAIESRRSTGWRPNVTFPQLMFRIARTPAGTVFAIRDRGIGIMPEHRERIFQLYFSTKSKQSGGNSGIGLAAVKAILDNMHATIGVASATRKPGQQPQTWADDTLDPEPDWDDTGTLFQIIFPSGEAEQ